MEADPEYTALNDKILEHIACGMSVAKACDEEHFTKQGFFKRLFKDKALVDQYMRAREARGHAHGEEVDEIKGKLLAGEIDAQTAARLFDMTKWQAGHEMAKVYGERIDVTGIPASQTNVLLTTRQRLAQLKSADGSKGVG